MSPLQDNPPPMLFNTPVPAHLWAAAAAVSPFRSAQPAGSPTPAPAHPEIHRWMEEVLSAGHSFGSHSGARPRPRLPHRAREPALEADLERECTHNDSQLGEAEDKENRLRRNLDYTLQRLTDAAPYAAKPRPSPPPLMARPRHEEEARAGGAPWAPWAPPAPRPDGGQDEVLELQRAVEFERVRVRVLEEALVAEQRKALRAAQSAPSPRPRSPPAGTAAAVGSSSGSGGGGGGDSRERRSAPQAHEWALEKAVRVERRRGDRWLRKLALREWAAVCRRKQVWLVALERCVARRERAQQRSALSQWYLALQEVKCEQHEHSLEAMLLQVKERRTQLYVQERAQVTLRQAMHAWRAASRVAGALRAAVELVHRGGTKVCLKNAIRHWKSALVQSRNRSVAQNRISHFVHSRRHLALLQVLLGWQEYVEHKRSIAGAGMLRSNQPSPMGKRTPPASPVPWTAPPTPSTTRTPIQPTSNQLATASEDYFREGLEDVLGSLTNLVLHLAGLPDDSDPALLALLPPLNKVLQVGESYLLEDCYPMSPTKRRTVM